MFMSGEYKVGMRRVQVFPQALQLGMHGVRAEKPAAKQRMVAVGDDAGAAMLSQVLAEPQFLRRTGGAAPLAQSVAVRIQHYDVPGTEIVAVVAFARRSGLRSPVLKIWAGIALPIFVVADRRPGSVLELAPRGAVEFWN